MIDKKEKIRTKKIFDILGKEYPSVKPALEYTTPFQLLISTMLSAQCTDARVNIVTKSLFKKYRKPEDYIIVSNAELEKDIFSTGFYRQKAKSIKNCCKELIEKHKGKVIVSTIHKAKGLGKIKRRRKKNRIGCCRQCVWNSGYCSRHSC